MFLQIPFCSLSNKQGLPSEQKIITKNHCNFAVEVDYYSTFYSTITILIIYYIIGLIKDRIKLN